MGPNKISLQPQKKTRSFLVLHIKNLGSGYAIQSRTITHFCFVSKYFHISNLRIVEARPQGLISGRPNVKPIKEERGMYETKGSFSYNIPYYSISFKK